jgi:hypothetical protein
MGTSGTVITSLWLSANSQNVPTTQTVIPVANTTVATPQCSIQNQVYPSPLKSYYPMQSSAPVCTSGG